MIEYLAEGHLYSSFIVAVLLVVTAVVVLHYGHICKRNNFLPGMRCNTLLMYYVFLKSIHSKSRKHISPPCLILQCLCGLCKVFDKDRIAQFWIWNRAFVFFFKPETVEVILSSTVTIEKSSEYQFLHPWLGTGLLTSKGDKWRVRRKLLTPTFHFRVLDDFIPVFDEQSQVLVSKLKTLGTKPWIDIVPLITMCTLDIICQTAMGVKMNVQSGGCSDYVKAIYEIGEIFLYRAIRPWLWIDSMFYCFPSGKNFKANLQLVHNFTKKLNMLIPLKCILAYIASPSYAEHKNFRVQEVDFYREKDVEIAFRQVIKEKKQIMIENYSENMTKEKDAISGPLTTKKRQAFLEMLLEHHLADNSLTEEDIREEVDTFMFEGHDTTAMAVCWTLYNLGLHPNIQEDVIKELDYVFEEDNTRAITRNDLNKMKYLEYVIKETLRLYPSVPFIARELRDDIKVLDYKISAGSVCFIFPLMLHRDPESFPNPEKFDPERFFPQNSSRRHPYAYVPFSAGPRNCIGQKFAVMEEKAIVANILRNFRVESLDQKDKVNLIPDLIIRNADPLRMHFVPRH